MICYKANNNQHPQGFEPKKYLLSLKLTEEKVSKIDTKIEGLPELKEELVEKYRKEKEKKYKLDNDVDWIQERMEENKTFYKLRKEKLKKETEMAEEKTRGVRR